MSGRKELEGERAEQRETVAETERQSLMNTSLIDHEEFMKLVTYYICVCTYVCMLQEGPHFCPSRPGSLAPQ